jgi:UDP-N-acetylmuramate--alanine ligase
MNLNQIQNVYFIGIGGIGMSALLGILKNIGNEFYDKTQTTFNKGIDRRVIAIHFF